MKIRLLILCAIFSGCPAIGADAAAPLLAIKRLYVDRLSGGETATQMRDMIIASLLNAKLFALTENPERADTIMHGSSEDLVFTDEHHTSDSINGQVHGSKGAVSRGSASSSTGASVGQSETSAISERKHEATAVVRLVNKDGDVIWSTTQESQGAKFRGSSADVAEKITRRLIDDIQKARELARAQPK